MPVYVYIVYAIHAETQIKSVKELFGNSFVADYYCAALNKTNSTLHSYYVEKQIV